jgi:hypothetical protein
MANDYCLCKDNRPRIIVCVRITGKDNMANDYCLCKDNRPRITDKDNNLRIWDKNNRPMTIDSVRITGQE